MPNQRAPGQKLINVPMDEDFIAVINRSLRDLGYADRSQFIRDAIVEKLQLMRVKVPAHLAIAPSRIGKAGRPIAAKPASRQKVKPLRGETPAGVALDAAPKVVNSKGASEDEDILDALEDEGRKPPPKSRR